MIDNYRAEFRAKVRSAPQRGTITEPSRGLGAQGGSARGRP